LASSLTWTAGVAVALLVAFETACFGVFLDMIELLTRKSDGVAAIVR
jgi:hypothetical protein